MIGWLVPSRSRRFRVQSPRCIFPTTLSQSNLYTSLQRLFLIITQSLLAPVTPLVQASEGQQRGGNVREASKQADYNRVLESFTFASATNENRTRAEPDEDHKANCQAVLPNH